MTEFTPDHSEKTKDEQFVAHPSLIIFPIFGEMKTEMNRIYVLFSVLSLSLFIAGCGVFVSEFAHNHFSNHRECADFTTHIEHSHLISFGEEIHPGNLPDEAKNKDIQIIPLFDISFENTYISFIWQPPKYS